MDRTPVVSSHVADVGYDATTSTLEVGFRDGTVYQYFAVPPEIAGALLAASSVGSYLAAHIKGGYEYRRVS